MTTTPEEEKPLSVEEWGEKVERYSRRENIGSGAFKSVFRAYDDEEGTEVAWNQIKINTVGKANKQKILGEITILEQLENQNIIKIFDSWEAPNGYLIFITEIMSSGTLKQFIQMSKKILSGLEYLHNRETPIIHRDIKCDNIFLNGNKGEVKIGDLGLSIVMKDKKFASSVIGTPEFMAPEQYEEFYDEKVDIYAFGMCVLEMVTGNYPYSECENAAQVYRRVTNGILPQGLKKIKNKFVREFIMLCLSDKTTRPSATELLRHPFMQVTPEDDEIIFSLASNEQSEENSKEQTKSGSESTTVENLQLPNVGESKKSTPKTQESNGSTSQKIVTKPTPKTVEPSVNETKKKSGGFKVVIVDRKGLELQLKLFLRLNGAEKEIQFPFSLQSDTPEIVAQEMAAELAMEEKEWIGVSDAIKFALKNNTTIEKETEKESTISEQPKTPVDDVPVVEKPKTPEEEKQTVEETLPEEINFYEVLKTKVPSENLDAIKLAYEALLKKHRLERENFYQFIGLSTLPTTVQSSPKKEEAKQRAPQPSKTKENVNFAKSNKDSQDSQDSLKNYLGYVDSLSNSVQMLTDSKLKSVKSVKASIDEDIHELMVQKGGGTSFTTIKAAPEDPFETGQDAVDDNF